MGLQKKLVGVKLLAFLVVFISATMLLIFNIGQATYDQWTRLVIALFGFFGVLHEIAKTGLNKTIDKDDKHGTK